MKLRLKNPHNKDITDYFEGVLGKATVDILNNNGYQDLEYKGTLRDSHKHPFAYLFERNGLLEAYNVNGELYTENEYVECKAVSTKDLHLANVLFHSDVFSFKRTDGKYDIFHKDKIFSKNVEEEPYVMFASDEDETNFVIMKQKNGIKIYDIKKEEYLEAKKFGNEIYDINRKFKKVIFRHEHKLFNGNTTIVQTFDGFTFYTFNTDKIYQFSDVEDYFIRTENSMSGLTIRIGIEFFDVLDCLYENITCFSEDKIIANTDDENFEIYRVENKNLNTVRCHKICEINNVSDVQLFDDTEEIVVTLRNGKKILYSHYLLANSEKYECDDIFHEKGNLFKCFQFNEDTHSYEITYMFEGQAVNYNSFKDNKCHLYEGKTTYSLFTQEGTLLSRGDVSDTAVYFAVNNHDDFMTIEKEGYGKVLSISIMDYSVPSMCFNLVTGKKFDFHNRVSLVWHNVFMTDNFLHDIYVRFNMTGMKLVAGFNEFLVLKKGKDVYISDCSHG